MVWLWPVAILVWTTFPWKPELELANLPEPHHDQRAQACKADSQDRKRDLHLEQRVAAPAWPRSRIGGRTLRRSPGFHWNPGSTETPWPDCCTAPENDPSAAIVKLPLQLEEPLRAAVAVNQVSLASAIE